MELILKIKIQAQFSKYKINSTAHLDSKSLISKREGEKEIKKEGEGETKRDRVREEEREKKKN